MKMIQSKMIKSMSDVSVSRNLLVKSIQNRHLKQ